MSDDDAEHNARLLSRVVEDPERWPALIALRGDDEVLEGDYDVADERRTIFDLALNDTGGDENPPTDLIAAMAEPRELYDNLAMLCREVLRLRLEIEELRRTITLQAN